MIEKQTDISSLYKGVNKCPATYLPSAINVELEMHLLVTVSGSSFIDDFKSSEDRVILRVLTQLINESALIFVDLQSTKPLYQRSRRTIKSRQTFRSLLTHLRPQSSSSELPSSSLYSLPNSSSSSGFKSSCTKGT